MADGADLNNPADWDFIVTCYEVLLGRELDTLDVIRDRAGWPKSEVIQSIVESAEFINEVLPTLETGYPFMGGRFSGEPSLRQRLWAADHFRISSPTSQPIRARQDWRTLLTHIMQAAVLLDR